MFSDNREKVSLFSEDFSKDLIFLYRLTIFTFTVQISFLV